MYTINVNKEHANQKNSFDANKASLNKMCNKIKFLEILWKILSFNYWLIYYEYNIHKLNIYVCLDSSLAYLTLKYYL